MFSGAEFSGEMTPEAMFRGAITALITPFRNGQVDESALRRIVRWQIEQGIHGLVPVGTTGESPTLSEQEHKRVVEITVEEAAGRVPVIAGAGSNNPLEAVQYSHHAFEVGADVRFFGDRLNFDVSYYSAVTKDQIILIDWSVNAMYF